MPQIAELLNVSVEYLTGNDDVSIVHTEAGDNPISGYFSVSYTQMVTIKKNVMYFAQQNSDTLKAALDRILGGSNRTYRALTNATEALTFTADELKRMADYQ